MAKGVFKNLSFRAGTSNTEQGVQDTFATIARPKLKFNFTVTFKFRVPIDLGFDNKPEGGEMADEVTFALKQSSRPNPTINYTDVNYYNYRTKVATKVDYGTIQMTMYDDVQNNAHNLLEAYLKSVSPIANVRKERASLLNERSAGARNGAFNTESSVIDLEGADQKINGGTGSLGPLPNSNGGEHGLIENITIRHWFFSQTERRQDDGPSTSDQAGTAEEGQNTLDPNNIQYVEYQFINPKVINMTFDELDMTQSESSTLMVNFNYDSVFINSPRASAEPTPAERESDGNTFTIDDVRARIEDIQRLIRRVRRLDTVPDISVLETAGTFTPPITGNLPNIQLPKPDVDLPSILDTS